MKKQALLGVSCLAAIGAVTLGIRGHTVAAPPAPPTAAEAAAASGADEDVRAARAVSRAFQRVAKRIEPAVVNITAIRRVQEVTNDMFFPRPTGRMVEQSIGFGSGVLVDPSGIILTNNHVVEPAEKLKVKLSDGREFDATVLGRDPLTDLAVVKLKDPPRGEELTIAPLGDSDSLEVGDWVIAIGSPFGFANTVTTGIVSAKSRSGIDLPGAARQMYQDFIQTDAAINPGNSGGPLLDLEGKVVGINSAIATRAGGSEGIGFAIPVQIARGVMDSILKSGRVVRGFVGIDLEELTPARLRQMGVKQEGGVRIKTVEENAPASKAGLKPDDIIVKFNGRPMSRASTLRAAIAVSSPGSKAAVEVLREGKPLTLSVEISDWNASAAATLGGIYVERFGGIVRTVDNSIRKQLGRGFGRVQGVIVRSVDANGLAGNSQLEENDVIVAVDGNPISTAEEFKKAIEGSDLKEGVRLDMIRNRMRGYIDLREE